MSEYKTTTTLHILIEGYMKSHQFLIDAMHSYIIYAQFQEKIHAVNFLYTKNTLHKSMLTS